MRPADGWKRCWKTCPSWSYDSSPQGPTQRRLTILSEPPLTDITIYGQSYRLRAEHPERLRSAAALVDARMRGLAASGGTVDTSRLILLAALDLADDLLLAQNEREDLERRVKQLTKRLEAEVGEAGRELGARRG